MYSFRKYGCELCGFEDKNPNIPLPTENSMECEMFHKVKELNSIKRVGTTGAYYQLGDGMYDHLVYIFERCKSVYFVIYYHNEKLTHQIKTSFKSISIAEDYQLPESQDMNARFKYWLF